MNGRDQVTVVDLLREREGQFVRVWQCEDMIAKIVGPSFQFPAPPPLPSALQHKAKPKPAKPAGPPALRRLKSPRENAYRIRFVYDGRPDSSFQTDPELLRTLMKLEASDFRILAIETVCFRAPDDWDTVETIYEDTGA